jgi:thiosulfate/3-mercaptopyruvate sulfurtransferase
MSRSDVLVDAEWLEAHRGDPRVVIVEVDEDTSATTRATSAAR